MGQAGPPVLAVFWTNDAQGPGPRGVQEGRGWVSLLLCGQPPLTVPGKLEGMKVSKKRNLASQISLKPGWLH